MNAAIRLAAFERSEGCCEACGKWAGEALHCDHFFGRRSEEVDTVWMLCPTCDYARTQNHPSAAHWLSLFITHCGVHQYCAAAVRARGKLLWREALARGAA